MLVISEAQMRGMDAMVVELFVQALVDELPRTFPAFIQGLSRADLLGRCRAYVAAGRESGLSHRADLHGFVVLSLLLGPGFQSQPEIAEVLRGDAVADGRKMLVVTSAILGARRAARLRSGGRRA